MKCSHVFCLKCIKNWAKYTNTCPLCKEEFLQIARKGAANQQEIIKIEPKKLDFDEDDDDALSGKSFLFIIELVPFLRGGGGVYAIFFFLGGGGG